MPDSRLLDAPWPIDLDPATVPFKGRTVTVLRRHGFFDNPAKFDSLTVATVAGWWNAGSVTVDDLIVTGNHAIKDHHDSAAIRHRVYADLQAVATEPWAAHIWIRDPRFTQHLPKCDATVCDIVIVGTPADRRYLSERLNALRTALEEQKRLSLPDAVSEYVQAISGQDGAAEWDADPRQGHTAASLLVNAGVSDEVGSGASRSYLNHGDNGPLFAFG